MSLLPVSDLPTAPAGAASLREEAARYALLRRIAPAIRHHLAGTLQPISMISAILDRRLQAPTPDLLVLRENSKSISTLSRSAAQGAMNLITWVAPKENGIIELQPGVEECAGMLSTDLAFRGFSVDNRLEASAVHVSLFALRTVFTASLIALTDAAPGPCPVVFTSEPAGDHTRVCILLEPTAGDDAAPEAAGSYRALRWDDVQALADAEQVGLRHSATHVEMLFAHETPPEITV